jgi:ubiquinone/menaquinone biosynthesis C-methylase UbiE
MRRFSAEYLQTTREGMWEQRETLEALELSNRERVLDVGAGSGALTRVLRAETAGTVVALDADGGLLDRVEPPRVRGDATRLPVQEGTFDLVVCQALLINLDEPAAALEQFRRVSSELVGAVEPDNAEVTVESTVPAESRLERRAREAYLRGSEVRPTLGDAGALFERVELEAVSVRRYDHRRVIEPPYTEQALEDARRKASGEGLERDRGTLLAGGMSPEAVDELRADWRAMGRTAVEQMQTGEYRRRERVPFYVTVGRVG